MDPDVAALLALDDLTSASALQGKSPSTVRRLMLEQILAVDGPPPGGVRSTPITIAGPATSLAARKYVPDDLPRGAPGLVYLHGGGFVVCDLDTHEGLCRRLARGVGCRVISVDYRLGPEHRFPAAVDDAVAAVRWVLANAESLDIDPARVAVCGDSAGGNLSAVASRHLRQDERRPALQGLIYPATDFTRALPSHESMGDEYFLTQGNIDWYLDHYVPQGVDLRHPDLSPLFAEDLHGCPAALVVTAGFDPLRDEGAAYADRLRDAGVSVTYREHRSLIHGFALMTASIPAAAAAVEELCRDIREALRAV